MNTQYEMTPAEEKAFDISCALEAYMNAVESFAECKSRGDRGRLVSNGLDAAFLLAKQAGSKTASKIAHRIRIFEDVMETARMDLEYAAERIMRARKKLAELGLTLPESSLDKEAAAIIK